MFTTVLWKRFDFDEGIDYKNESGGGLMGAVGRPFRPRQKSFARAACYLRNVSAPKLRSPSYTQRYDSSRQYGQMTVHWNGVARSSFFFFPRKQELHSSFGVIIMFLFFLWGFFIFLISLFASD